MIACLLSFFLSFFLDLLFSRGRRFSVQPPSPSSSPKPGDIHLPSSSIKPSPSPSLTPSSSLPPSSSNLTSVLSSVPSPTPSSYSSPQGRRSDRWKTIGNASIRILPVNRYFSSGGWWLLNLCITAVSGIEDNCINPLKQVFFIAIL